MRVTETDGKVRWKLANGLDDLYSNNKNFFLFDFIFIPHTWDQLLVTFLFTPPYL